MLHNMSVVPGGCSEVPTTDKIAAFFWRLNELRAFVDSQADKIFKRSACCAANPIRRGAFIAVETAKGTVEVEVGGYWCAVNGTRCDGETDPCHLCPTAAEPIPTDDTPAGAS